MANEDAKRDQVHRDQSVTQPPETHFNDDIFDREKENEADYTEKHDGQKKNSGREAPSEPRDEKTKKVPPEADTTRPTESDDKGHFSTYA